jgi:hypothetical protein
VLPGYELYLVEQWACSRQSPTLVIATYTGDDKHSVVVGVLGVPADESTWSPRLRLYFKAIEKYHARPKETPLGDLMVTNLSSFPSALTVIPVPDGDIRKHRQVFIVNEDLKRLGCSGRSALTLSDPTAATQAKFYQLYKTCDRIPFFQSVLELVKLCQVSLFMFGKLEQEYIDGLLCDVTETAIGDWWTQIGAEYYNIEPTDGILGPTTVAALLGTLMGARNRLHWYGAPVTKDVFDIDSTKRGIAYFQKAQKLERTRRLDRQTLLKLHNVTAKAAASEGWGVQKAVKSTVAEIGGKRGEIVIGMVGGRDKGGISDIETLDIDKFIALAYGERAKWLWQGKPRRTGTDHHEKSPDMGHMLFGKEELAPTQPSKRIQSLPLEEELEKKKDDSPGVYSTPPPGSATSMADSPSEKEVLRRTVFKSVAGKMSDARSGLGRIKASVGGGLRGHASRPSKDESPESGLSSPSMGTLAHTSTALSGPAAVGRAFTWKQKPEEYMNALKSDKEADFPPSLVESLPDTDKTAVEQRSVRGSAVEDTPKAKQFEGEFNTMSGDNRKDTLPGPPSVAGSAIDEADLLGPLMEAERSTSIPLFSLQRRHSVELSRLSLKQPLNENRWPRRLSFGDAEEAVLRWEEIAEIPDASEDGGESADMLQKQANLAEVSRSLYANIALLKRDVEPWVRAKISGISAIDQAYARDTDALQALYYSWTDTFQRVKASSTELVAEERGHLTESLKDVEVLLARLEYEIAALRSKVEDVEDGVVEFEKQVESVEKRAEELKTQLETESWLHWFVRTLTGIGTGPNITRPRQ